MTKFELNGVTFCNFGSNNYSNGMELITCYPMPDNMIQRVLNGEFHGVYLNPSAPCCEEFYGVLGTPDQYYGPEGFYNSQKQSVIARRYFEILGGVKVSRDREESAQHQAESEYKDWWLD